MQLLIADIDWNITESYIVWRIGTMSIIFLLMVLHWTRDQSLHTLRPRQDGRRFPDDTFERIFLNKNVRVSIRISLKFVLKGLIDNIPALVQIMAGRRSGDKPLSEPMMINSLTHICVTRRQWVKMHGLSSMRSCGLTRPQWVDECLTDIAGKMS